MTLQINMRPGEAANGDPGTGIMTSAGNPWSVSDGLAQDLVQRGKATPFAWPNQPPLSAVVATPPQRSLLAVVIGNSIAAGANNGPQRLAANSYWASGSDLHTALALTGGKGLRFGRLTEGTRMDRWGVYSYSGQRLDQINADLPTNFWPALVTASVVPEVIIGHSLLENDLGQGASFSVMVGRLTAWLIDAQTRYPSAIIWLMTPRPSYSYDSPAKVKAYQDIREYILALDDGSRIFVSRMDAYENPASPGTPLSGHTDASVHPNVLGGQLNGRTMAFTLRRINGRAVTAYRAVSSNYAMTGSGAASGTNVTGTQPTGVTYAGSANGTFVMSARDPGLQFQVTQTAGALSDVAGISLGAVTVTGLATQFSPYMRVRIDSGAEQLRLLSFRPRFSDGTTSPFFNFQLGAGTDADSGYQNGDELEIWTPPITQADVGTAGAITSVTPWLYPTRKTGGGSSVLTSGTVQFTVLAAGVGLVA